MGKLTQFPIKLQTIPLIWFRLLPPILSALQLSSFSQVESNLFPATVIFTGGFAGLGIFSLVTSFVTSNKYGFLILRGLGGIAGALTIPSSYHLMTHMFPDSKELQAKLALLGMAGGLGNCLGL